MFVDASAMVSILAEEPGWERFSVAIEDAAEPLTSPLAVWEVVNAMARLRKENFEDVSLKVERFLAGNRIRLVPITAEIGAVALDAARRFGRGRHPAGLNFGDCFAYACARHHGVPLLFKGEDFPQTDIEAA